MVLRVCDLPGIVRHEEEGMEDVADEVVQRGVGGEGVVAAFCPSKARYKRGQENR
jgi:hypothetical protein